MAFRQKNKGDKMSKQEQQDHRAQGREVSRQYAPQGSLMNRSAYPAALLIPPGDLFRMSPFSLMRRMSEEMDRVMAEFGLNRSEAAAAAWAPTIEVSQTDGKYQVRAELPGVNPAEVKLEITGEAVILEGERKVETQENKGGMQVTERQYGRFYRAIPLPEGAKVDEAKAKFENGVLEVTVPVQAQKEKRRQIQIEASAPAQAGSAPAPAQAGSSGKAA
jgi:HSP20 family protein